MSRRGFVKFHVWKFWMLWRHMLRDHYERPLRDMRSPDNALLRLLNGKGK